MDKVEPDGVANILEPFRASFLLNQIGIAGWSRRPATEKDEAHEQNGNKGSEG
jgi:hypothetical protein